ncbi:MAG: MFS transporter, partial [Xanthomonadaceae bacterium]|nr:MFS transporter [Xanthomonadaceae bacterium]
PRVVALMCSMLLIGMALSAVIFGLLLRDFSQLRLIQVIQGSAAVTMLLNIAALWKQEARDPSRTAHELPTPSFRESWESFSHRSHARRRLIALGLGTVAFSMQDILLEPFGGEVLKLPVASTTALTAALALGGLAGFVLAARALVRGVDPYRMAAYGAVVGIAAFSAVILSAPMASTFLFALGVAGIGVGSGLFGHCTLTAAMSLAPQRQIGLALGVWGAVQATAAGGAIAISGLLRDGIAHLAASGALGEALAGPATGYTVVYHLELGLLFATLVAIGPLVRHAAEHHGTVGDDGGDDAVWPNLKSMNLREEVTQ